MHDFAPVEHPTGESMDRLCDQLSEWSSRWSGVSDWPAEALRLCGKAGVYRWFLPPSQGGFGWSDADQTRGYLRLAQSDLTTTFIITQYMGALKRIAGSNNGQVIDRWMSDLISGEAFATVGISHLTTSRRHLGKPALAARQTEQGFVLNGLSPWVTGAPHGDLYVVGATLVGDEPQQSEEVLLAVPADSPGLQAGKGFDLVALSASCTDKLVFEDVLVDTSHVLAGPMPNVLQSGTGAGTGGLQTSTLALGLSRAATEFLADEASRREDLRDASNEMTRELDELQEMLLEATTGEGGCDASEIRGRANRMVLRATQAALTAAKGAGFVEGHPVGRWCRQALFFLVWSCPQPVAQAHLCELAFGAE